MKKAFVEKQSRWIISLLKRDYCFQIHENNDKEIFIEHLLCARRCAKPFSGIIGHNPLSHLARGTVTSPISQVRKWASCPRSHSREEAEPGAKPAKPASASLALEGEAVSQGPAGLC